MCLFEPKIFRCLNFMYAATYFCDFVCSAAHLVRDVLIFNFTSFAVSSGKFSSCTVSCSAFSRSGLFLLCSDIVFHRHPHSAIKSSINYGGRPSIAKIIVRYFETSTEKGNQTANWRNTRYSLRRKMW